jgi:hypothetical protein
MSISRKKKCNGVLTEEIRTRIRKKVQRLVKEESGKFNTTK